MSEAAVLEPEAEVVRPLAPPAAGGAGGARRLRGYTRVLPSGGVESVQWVDLPRDHPARRLSLAELERRYFTWVPRLTAGLVRPRALPGGELVLAVQPAGWPVVMRLSPPEERGGLRLRRIRGGMLARPAGTFSVEWAAPGRLMVAVRAFQHRLPAALYWAVQVPLHERTSDGFLRQVRDEPPRA